MPIAFHVDYVNDPWEDDFSDPLYSQRQMAYNQFYTKPKNQEQGLYYTAMLMIDGRQAVNGRDPASAEAAIRQALVKKPAVGLDVALELGSDGRSGAATIKVPSRLACARGALKGALMLSPIRSMALAATLVLLAAPSAFSQGKGKPASDEQPGLKVGEKAPKFTLKDQEGKERSLVDLLKKGKVALVFYRSADW